jgi:hypothetical protein
MSMRLYSFRSILYCGLTLVASAILMSSPTAAAPVHPLGYAVLVVQADHVDVSKALQDFAIMADKMHAQRVAAIFLDTHPAPGIGATGGLMHPFGLKPEYAESYATDGLSLDMRRRC